MRELIGYLAFSVSIVASILYIIDVLKGRIKPERISFLLWTVLGGVYFVSALYEGGAVWFTAALLVGPLAVFLLSLKYGVGGKSKLDRYSLVVASSALLALFITKNAAVSLIIALVIDAIGLLLVYRKVYIDPFSETKPTWVAGALGSLLGIFSVENISFENLAYPVYGFMAALSVTLLLVFGHKRKGDIEQL